MRLLKSKRGEEIEDIPSKFFYFIVVGIFLAAIFMFLVLVMGQYMGTVTYIPPQAEQNLLLLRFFYSPDCFAYEENSRVYAGVVDLSKFNKGITEKCYSMPEEGEAFKFTLLDKSVATKNWNDGRAFDKKFPKKVLFMEDGKIVQGSMMVELQNVE